MTRERQQKGRAGEELACEFLRERGLEVVARNFRCSLGEIDLICLEGETVVFVEVKSRRSTSYGLPQEAVTVAKQRRLTRLAQWYIKVHRLEGRRARFDVVAIMWREGAPEINWIVNAFDARP